MKESLLNNCVGRKRLSWLAQTKNKENIYII